MFDYGVLIIMKKNLYENFIVLDTKKNEFPKSLYKDISDLIWKYTGKTKLQFQNENFDKKTDELFEVGKKIFEEALESDELVKLMIALCIYDFCNFKINYSILESKSELLKKMKNAFSSIKLDVQIPMNAPYNEKKLHEILIEAEKTENIKQRFEVMETLRYHSNTFDKMDFTWVLFIRLLWIVERKSILEILAYKNTVTIEFILFSLDLMLEDFCNEKIENEYLEIRIASLLSYRIESKYLQNSNNDFSKLPDFSDYYYNLFSSRGNTIVENKDTFHFLHLTSLSYYMGCICAKKIQLCNYFIKFNNFSFDQTGQAFSKGFLDNYNDDKLLLDIGEKILNNVLNTEIKCYSTFNEYFGFLDLFINYHAALRFTKDIYLEKINDLNTTITSIQNSWDFSNITKKWFLLWLLILSNKIYKYKFSIQEIKKNASNLFDKRNLLSLDVSESIFANMVTLLESPENVKEIIAYKNHKEIRLSIK